ncbi:MAG TPA: regulatory protein RecX [Actinomycetota bacterium]|nr:regulatory protein RecX [Actinomycetota bacterium]
MEPGRNHHDEAGRSVERGGNGRPRRRPGSAPSERKPRGTARDRALNLLSFRDRSRRELEQRLLRAGFEPDDVLEALEALERVGLVDDERFARAVVEQEAGRRLSGRRAVAAALASKGVSREVAGAALAEIDDPESERRRAEELARSRVRRMGALAPEVAYRRLAGLLARRGFSPALCHESARRALDVESNDDHP